ncbi:UDP-2-acetamido-2,6-beta-L-arabino-hexul-4-ose reductase [Sphingomonas sp.]|uniref:UDP-2-acetamido-2,6-beta-L-arabino-hexul-4-ose reductase n=1 Tax=Sphingomonas sp. TaxID=28214 RepID=UPI002DD68A69|nr:NAD-dependent epimerase/dehydratase family protein [Sphingomonas sp.]
MTVRVLVTGADGFIGRNLMVHLGEQHGYEPSAFTRRDPVANLETLASRADVIVHLAGINRTEDPADFVRGNVDLTSALCDAIEVGADGGRYPVVIYASSIHAERDTDYGRSKRGAEARLSAAAKASGIDAHVFRLPNVFGKWCRPNYNSAIATFCHNIARGLPIRIDDPDAVMRLVYIDDVVSAFLRIIRGEAPAREPEGFATVSPEYRPTLGQVAAQLHAFRGSRENHIVERVGCGLTRALYSTYLSYLDPADFDYPVTVHRDPRGAFAEMLRTRDSGQISFFTAGPGVTRGGHYHHSKTEKFLVVKSRARFCFRHMVTGERHVVDVDGNIPRIVETIPGWAHDITNTGDEDMVVLLWANEQFDPNSPDTVQAAV